MPWTRRKTVQRVPLIKECVTITREKVRLWHIGSETVKVYLTPSDEQTYRFLVKELRAKHRDGVRKSRCMVIGKRGKPIRCDERNRCSDCPFGRTPENREPQEISWDELEGYDIPDIMAELSLSQRRVYDLVKKMKTIAAEVL